MWGIPDTHLSLCEYWTTLQICECAGYGIRGAPAHITGMGCGDYWRQDERYWLAFSIAKVERRLSKRRWLGFPIRRECFGPMQLEYKEPLILPHNWVRQIGPCVEDVISDAEALDLGDEEDPTDPVTLSIGVTFTDPDELILYYTGQLKYKIRPSEVTIFGGIATITIPRCRLLHRDYFINYSRNEDALRPPYSGVGANAYYEASVAVYRSYVNTTVGVTAVWFPGTLCPTVPCVHSTQVLCPYIQTQQTGVIQTSPATYDVDAGAWKSSTWAECIWPNQARLSYMAGMWDRYEEIEEDMTRAIIALAHNNLPEEYCSCAMQQRYYKRDTRPIEPPVNFGLGHSTWGVKEASEIINEYRIIRTST